MKSHRSLRADAARIWSAALRAVEPETAVRSFVKCRRGILTVGGRSIRLDEFEKIWIIGAGKAAAPMAMALERILGKHLSGGMLVTKYGHGLPLKDLEILEAGHPLPDANSLLAGERITRLAAEKIRPGDLVFCLFSGGGSALLVSPAPGITLEDKLETTRLLLAGGATIHEMNAIRKHLSCLKGGGLARLLAPTQVISLILSDVVGDSLDTIASGPLVPDGTSFNGCLGILRKLDLLNRIPADVRLRLEEGAAGVIAETPKKGDPAFRRKDNVIIGSNARACTAAAAAARRLGYHTMILTTRLEGDTGEAAGFHMSVAEEIVLQGRPLRRPACILSGGETTVRLTGRGKGGRNQEFVLRCVEPLTRLQAPCVVASVGTDGTDGPTDAAGAIADNTTLSRSLKLGAQFLTESLRNNDSYEFFNRLGSLIITGPTRTNVMDLHLVLLG
jgi:hydroxypyruvate reductase